MTIPRLSGWWDEIAPAINSFSQSIPQILNPNADYQRKVRDAIAANPQMLEQYAEMERRQPGILKAMKLDKLGEIVKRTPAGINELINVEAINAFQKSPEAREEILGKAIGTKTTAERAQAKATLESTQASTERTKLNTEIDKIDKSLKEFELSIAPQITQLRGEDAQLKLQELEQYRAAVPLAKAALAKYGTRIFDAWKEGKISAEEVSAINRVPEIRKIWDDRFNIWKEENDQKYRLAMIAAQRAGGTDYAEATKQMNRRHFIDNIIAADPGFGITPEMASAYLDQPMAVQQALQSMPDNPASNPQARALWQVGQAVKSYNSATRVKQDKAKITAFNSALATKKDQIQTALYTVFKDKKASDKDKEAAITMYNDALESISDTYGMYGEAPAKMRFEVGTLGGVKRIVFTNTPDEELEKLGKEIGVTLRGGSKTQAKVTQAEERRGGGFLGKAAEFITGANVQPVSAEVMKDIAELSMIKDPNVYNQAYKLMTEKLGRNTVDSELARLKRKK